MSRIVVTGRIPEAGLDVLRRAGEVWAWDADEPIPDDVRDRQLATADAAVTLLTDRVDDAFLAAGPGLRVVANVAVGYNNIDVAACRERGVVVTNTPGVLTDATADLAMALTLMVTRRLGEGERLIRAGTPWQWGMFMMLGSGLQGRQLGVIGMGAIGEALADRARAFGMTIAYHNRRAVDAATEERLGARLVGLHELLETSDVVSLNCPYSDATHHLIDAAALDRMQETAFLVNTARGPIVDEAALATALRDGRIAGAALDVFEHEPDVHPDLLGLDNVVLVPHLGSATIETRSAMAELAARNVVEILAGREPLTPVSA
ncbi:MAG: D-glycerate dehydrogenase [Ilumatobacter sp.]|uniref:2-hydroxyacid dehydrogenase n=1 Tax=Ilumatobacter sp. TaxID=1967498 RepID=UPI00262750E3|nr:D-glycerate dehydrogenase [Ilumatobacter sp.]MDJ0767509.1 D-glycerate dehydrogenase [Ilumatobacter sp.]